MGQGLLFHDARKGPRSRIASARCIVMKTPIAMITGIRTMTKGPFMKYTGSRFISLHSRRKSEAMGERRLKDRE